MARKGRRSRFEIAFEAAILNLVIVRELDNKIAELTAQRNKIVEDKKDELREIFKMGYDACAEQMKGKIEPDYTVEEIDAQEEAEPVEIVQEETVVSQEEDTVVIDEKVDQNDIEIKIDDPVEKTTSNEVQQKNEDYSTKEKDIVDSVAYCRVCKKSCVPYNSTSTMELLSSTLEFPSSDVVEIKNVLEKTINFLGKKQANEEINGTARNLLMYMTSLSNDISPEQFILENNLTNDQFVASVGIAANAISKSTRGVVELQWYSTNPDESGYSQFEDLRLRLVFVKRIYSMFERNLIKKQYQKVIDEIDHYKE